MKLIAGLFGLHNFFDGDINSYIEISQSAEEMGFHGVSLTDHVVMGKIKPPIFWKDKPMFLKLLKKWDKQSLIGVLKYLGEVEKKIKSNSKLNSLTIVKNSITNICSNSWVYFYYGLSGKNL